jgi:intein/homing endonuclease
MADGTTKAIESIQVNDELRTWNVDVNRGASVRVLNTHAPYVVKDYIVLNGSLALTGGHPMYRKGEWVAARQLYVGDVITGLDGVDVVVRKVETRELPAKVYNIQVEGGTYVANGIVVHNKEDCEDYMPAP